MNWGTDSVLRAGSLGKRKRKTVMKPAMFAYLAWPLVGLGFLLAAACLTGVWYINKLETDLGHAVQHDAKRLQAAEEMQIWLRQLRFHSVLYMAQRIDARRAKVLADEAGFEAALAEFRKGADLEEDTDLADTIARDYSGYQATLEPLNAEAPAVFGEKLLNWADEHSVRQLTAPCRELASRQRARMSETLERVEAQNRWAGRGLLAIGGVGVLGGLLSGYAVARRYTQVVGLLSVHVQAAQALIVQEIGTLTVAAPQHFGELDEQLDQIVRKIRDMCERLQQQEREILWAEHLAAVGHLAAGVAHEVRNPLTGMKFLIEAALRPDGPNTLTRDDLTLIHQEILRMERTVQELLNYARTPAVKPRTEDVRDLVQRAIEIVRGRAERQRVDLVPSVLAVPVSAPVDRDQFLSMLTNLLINALDATPPGGRVGLTLGLNPDGNLRIDISDTGPGISPQAMEKLFMPFVTTKPTGTGLGLTMARRVARAHGGSLTAVNRAQGGACFTLILPRTGETHA